MARRQAPRSAAVAGAVGGAGARVTRGELDLGNKGGRFEDHNVYMYVHIRTYKYTYHIYIYIDVHTLKKTMCVYIYISNMYMHAQSRTYKYIYIFMYMYIYTYINCFHHLVAHPTWYKGVEHPDFLPCGLSVLIRLPKAWM